jgi:hypothetical protein
MQRSIHRLSVSENALPFARFAMRTHSCLACFSVCAVQKVRTQNRASARSKAQPKGSCHYPVWETETTSKPK